MLEPSFMTTDATTPQGQKQSKIGIASLVIGLVSVLMFCVAFAISFGYGLNIALANPTADPTAFIDQSSPLILIASGLFCCSPGLSLLGLGLGIGAVIQKVDKRTFGVLGLVLSGISLLAFLGIFAIGLLGQSGALGL
jgi:hypothetical protein